MVASLDCSPTASAAPPRAFALGHRGLAPSSRSSRSSSHSAASVPSFTPSSIVTAAAAARGEPLGLFGIRGLSAPRDFAKLARRALAESEARRAVLAVAAEPVAANGEPPLSAWRTLRELDAISNALCTVMDAAELCRQVESQSRHSIIHKHVPCFSETSMRNSSSFPISFGKYDYEVGSTGSCSNKS